MQKKENENIYKRNKLDWAKSWLKSEKNNYIDGRWISSHSKRKFNIVNPSNQEGLASFAVASEKDVTLAAEAAKKAFVNPDWAKLERRKRGTLLNEIANLIRTHAEELATLDALSNGKTYREALLDDMPDASEVFEYYAGWVDKYYGEVCPVNHGFLNYTLREPIGVCALIVPWNFPFLLACWKIAPALALGNTVVIKPSEYTPLSMIRFFELLSEKINVPPGVLNLLLGDGETGTALCSSSLVDKISFTGSTEVGRFILKQSADSNLKRVTLELGGKSPNILFADVPDLDAALQRSFSAMFSHKGEKCSEPTRLLVDADIFDEVVTKLKKMADAVRCGDAFDESAEQGAQCNLDQFNKIMSYIEIAKRDGLPLISGGERDVSGSNAKGLFIRPTIYGPVNPTHTLALEEIFGPVLVVIPFKTENEAITIANNTMYGLAAGLWTADTSRAHRVAAQLDAGMIFVNRYGCYDFSSPFGGVKQSGWGKEMGIHSLESYSRVKSVWIKYG